MDIEMVFNELSLQTSADIPPAKDIHTAQQWMSVLIQTMVVATGKFGLKRVLRIENDFFYTLLAPNYSINLWRNDRNVDREEKRFFTNLQTKYPALVDFEDSEIENKYLLSDFRHEGKRCHGLAIACLLEALALSLNSDSKWDKNQLLLQSPETLTIYHASQPRHLGQNIEWIRQQLKKNNLWLINRLPQYGKCPYVPHKNYYRERSDDFPTKIHGGKKVFIDHKNQYWQWDDQEKHWDVQFEPYGRDNYFRVSSDGRLLD